MVLGGKDSAEIESLSKNQEVTIWCSRQICLSQTFKG